VAVERENSVIESTVSVGGRAEIINFRIIPSSGGLRTFSFFARSLVFFFFGWVTHKLCCCNTEKKAKFPYTQRESERERETKKPKNPRRKKKVSAAIQKINYGSIKSRAVGRN
jgi:hypothetical protein